MFVTWKHRSKFSLAMYLGMWWSCLVCLPYLVELLPCMALGLTVAGCVPYTGRVISPFFVRNNNNNLDHSIWHMFVLAGEHFFSACLFPEPSLLSFLDPQSFYFYFVICT